MSSPSYLAISPSTLGRDPTPNHAGDKMCTTLFRSATLTQVTYPPRPQHQEPHSQLSPKAHAANGGAHPGDDINNGMGDCLDGLPHGRRPFTESGRDLRTPPTSGKTKTSESVVARETDQAQGPMRQQGRGISLCTHRLVQDRSELLIDMHYWLFEGLDEIPAEEPEDANHNSLDFAAQNTEYITDFYMAYVQNKEQDGWRLIFSTTADPSPNIELPDKTNQLELATIAKLFHLPIDDACKKLGTCSTKLKKICRQKGLSRWPYRKVRSIQNRLEKSSTPSMPLGKAPPPGPTAPRVMDFPLALQGRHNNGGPVRGLDLSTPFPVLAADNLMLGEGMGQNAAGTNRKEEEEEVLDLWRKGAVGQVGLGPLEGSSATNEPAESFMLNDSGLLTNPSINTLPELLIQFC
eukprot:gene5878-30733_t